MTAREKLVQRYTVELLLTGTNEDVVCEVDRDDFEQLRTLFGEGVQPIEGFFGIRTLDGNHIAINSVYVQGLRLRTDVAEGSRRARKSSDPIKICLCDRAPIEAGSASPLVFFDLLWQLELGVDGFVPYDDGQHRPWAFSKSQIVWASGPIHLIAEGERLAIVEGGLGDTEQSAPPVF